MNKNISLNVEIEDGYLTEKIAEIKEHIEAINNIVFDLRLSSKYVTAKENTAPDESDTVQAGEVKGEN